MYQKMDIFKKVMWYSYYEQPSAWIELKVERVHEIIELNKQKEDPESLEAVADQDKVYVDIAPQYENVVGQDSISRFDNKGKSNKGRNNRNKNNNRNRNNNNRKRNQSRDKNRTTKN